MARAELRNPVTYSLIEHTADIGIHVQAKDLNSLFADAARGLFAIIVDNPDEIQVRQSIEIQIPGENREHLLMDWLAELLIKFELDKLLLGKFEVVVGSRGLHALAHGEAIDFSRHRLAHEVKAITYHRLAVAQTAQGWTAEVLVDI